MDVWQVLNRYKKKKQNIMQLFKVRYKQFKASTNISFSNGGLSLHHSI